GIVIGLTKVSWTSILPYVIPLSLLGLLLDWYMSLRTFNKRMQSVTASQTAFEQTAATIEPIQNSNPKRIYHVLFAVLVFIIIVFFTESRLDYSFLTLVSLLVIPFSLIW